MRWCKRRERVRFGTVVAGGRTPAQVLRGGLRLSAMVSASVVKAVGSMPFAGRNAIRPSVYNCKDARTRRGRIAAYAGHLALTSIMHAGHGYQAFMGARTFGVWAPSFLYEPTLASGAGALVSGLYCLANTAVVCAQTDIAVRLGADQLKRWNETPETAAPPKERAPTSAKRASIDFAATLGGQAAFMTSYVGSYVHTMNNPGNGYPSM